jgi:hypothetical protein
MSGEEKPSQPSFLDEKGKVTPEVEAGSRFATEEQRLRILELVNEGNTVDEAEQILREQDREDSLDSYPRRK